MKTIKRQIEINRPQVEVFDLTQDYAKRLDWDSYLTKAYLLGNADEAGIGVDSFCQNRYGSVMISRYISFNRPHVAAVTMIKGPFILKRFSGAWNVKKINEQRSKLTFTYHFELKGGVIGRLLLPITSHLFASDMNKRLFAIKRYLESNIKRPS
jgi:ribosome-associated toxin RatA of RatAB toxin-antitoxin module